MTKKPFVEVNDTEMEGNEILETTVLAKVEEVEEIKSNKANNAE
jgi:hypothetical protein